MGFNGVIFPNGTVVAYYSCYRTGMSVTGGEGGRLFRVSMFFFFLGNDPDSSKSKHFEKILPRAFQRRRFTTAELCEVRVRVTLWSETA